MYYVIYIPTGIVYKKDLVMSLVSRSLMDLGKGKTAVGAVITGGCLQFS